MMSEKKLKGKITITKPTRNFGEEVVSIQIQDVNSSVRFLEVEIPIADFAQCLMGLARTDCALTVNSLDLVGKLKQRDTIEFEMPEKSYSDNKIANEIAEKVTPAGWLHDRAFSSQGSFFLKDGKNFARTGISRWVDADESNS